MCRHGGEPHYVAEVDGGGAEGFCNNCLSRNKPTAYRSEILFLTCFVLTNIYTWGAAHAEDVLFYFSQPYSPRSSPGPGYPGCWRTAPS